MPSASPSLSAMGAGSDVLEMNLQPQGWKFRTHSLPASVASRMREEAFHG